MDEITVFHVDFIENADGKEDATEYDITEEQIRYKQTLISKKIFENGRLVEERIYDGNEHIRTITRFSDGMLVSRESYQTVGDITTLANSNEFINGRLQKKDCIDMNEGGDDDQQNF